MSVLIFAVTMSAAANLSVASEFDAFAATQVEIHTARPAVPLDPIDPQLERIEALGGVEAVGVVWGLGSMEARPSTGTWVRTGTSIEVLAVTEGALDFMAPEVSGGSLLASDFAIGAPAVLLGGLSIQGLPAQPPPGAVITLGGLPFRVVGVIVRSQRSVDSVFNAYIPASTAKRLFPDIRLNPRVQIELRPGVADLVADEARLILQPNRPNDLVALYAPEAKQLRSNITGTLDSLAAVISLGLMVVSVISIGSTTMAAIVERRNEIGLRRALGATRRDIVWLILGETGLLGLLASLAGVVVALSASLLITALRGWPPVTPIDLIALAPLAGTIAGLAAGALPALRAASIQPSAAMR